MKAPDKIYVASYKGETFSSKWTREPVEWDTHIEYIRKDALLEWLESVLKCKPQDAGLFTEAAAIMLQQIIDKINSL